MLNVTSQFINLRLFRSFCTWLDMTKRSTMKLNKTKYLTTSNVASDNVDRKILKLHMRCSASPMYVDNKLLPNSSTKYAYNYVYAKTMCNVANILIFETLT